MEIGVVWVKSRFVCDSVEVVGIVSMKFILEVVLGSDSLEIS